MSSLPMWHDCGNQRSVPSMAYYWVLPQRMAYWLLVFLLVLPLTLVAQSESRTASNLPIIDMHFHAMWDGPDLKEPLTGFVSPKTPDELRRLNIAALNRYHIIKVVASGDQLESYEQELGSKIIAGILLPTQISTLGTKQTREDLGVSPASLRQMHKEGKLDALSEFAPQYAGLPPASPQLEQYWSVAEELEIPVGIHMGLGPPGAAYVGFPEYRMQLSNPLLLEDVLVRHPKLRVYICHAGWPFINELLGLLYAHPQVYVDVAVINWVLPQAEFHAYLRRIVDAGFADRIMYGSDNMNWPDSFGLAISRTSAPFLTENQKRHVLCRNAARFLRLKSSVCEQ
ncbi:MAG: amidohydrolase family protein [Acidobacteriaceae bacterium]|nr:amidohydrolase family protein [Acidobacteriaceae bacterium]